MEIDTIERKAFNLKFSLENPSGKRVIDMNGISKTYGTKTLFDKLDVVLARGEKIALLGPNGVGKSTLIKCINKEIRFDGEIEYGHNVKVGYFAQDSAEKLDPEATVFKTIDDIAVGDKRKDIRATLGAFLFQGQDIEKQVKVLSGGERTRLAICRLLFQEFNFLIMDEPTNHLDIQSKEILKEALKKYEGTLLLVSHDRDFLDGLSNKIWEINDGKIKTHYFGVNEFLDRINSMSLENPIVKDVPAEKKPAPTKVVSNEEKQKIKKLETKIKNCERKIEDLEAKLKEETKALENAPFDDQELYQAAVEKFESAKTDLEGAMANWEAAALELDELS